MSFVLNDAGTQQISFFDSCNSLTDREKKFLEKSWATYFAKHIFPKIDEKPFEVLYSQKDSRPNTPVNIQIGALIIKEFTNLSDDEILTALMFDIRFQHALHTAALEEQPLNDRTLGRFRERCTSYEAETGIDLLHDAIENLAEEMATMMNLDRSLKRMDSLMVSSNIKKMGRLELLYTCVAALAVDLKKQSISLPKELLHYTEEDDRNRIIYHNRSEDVTEKINVILKDAKALLELCETTYEESIPYQLLIRVLQEQTIEESDGSYRLRQKGDGGMTANILQNPADPDATFRTKAGNQYRGYVANVTEITGETGSIVTEYQYEKNTYSDSQFMKDSIAKMGKQEEAVTIVVDGAYSGANNQELAQENNVTLVATNLTGRETNEILADFEFSEDGKTLEKCAGGYAPKSCSYNENTGQCVVSFERSQCEECPYKEKCKPKMFKRVCRKTVSLNANQRAKQQQYRSTEDFTKMSNFRNGVEAIPSLLRRKYNIDRMPVRGLIRSKFFFGCKIGAMNFKKFCTYMQNLDFCVQNAVDC